MRLFREAYTWRLKPDQVAEYIRLHDAIPQHVVNLYRQAGIRDIAVYLSGCDIIMTLERDDDIYDQVKEQVGLDAIHAAFQQALAVTPDRSHPGGTYQQIFRLTADDTPPAP